MKPGALPQAFRVGDGDGFRLPDVDPALEVLKTPFAPVRFAVSGATGFDGFGEDVVACPGCQSPGKSTGNIHKPTLNWLWPRRLRFTRLREKQPA